MMETNIASNGKSYEQYETVITSNSSAFLSFCKEHVAMFTPLFKRSQIKVTEFHALAALAVTESGNNISDKNIMNNSNIRLDNVRRYSSYHGQYSE